MARKTGNTERKASTVVDGLVGAGCTVATWEEEGSGPEAFRLASKRCDSLVRKAIALGGIFARASLETDGDNERTLGTLVIRGEIDLHAFLEAGKDSLDT